ncbi:MAG: hypothetical protein AB7D06_00745 [Pedobacter sp.]
MIETCPLCGRYSLTPDYPPKPCPICEEEILNKASLTATMTHARKHRQPPGQRPDA